MRRSDLVSKVACVTKYTKKEVDLILTSILEIIVDTVSAGEKVTLLGFGSFRVRDSASRTCIHPISRKLLLIPACKKPIFSVGKFFKNKVNKNRLH